MMSLKKVISWTCLSLLSRRKCRELHIAPPQSPPWRAFPPHSSPLQGEEWRVPWRMWRFGAGMGEVLIILTHYKVWASRDSGERTEGPLLSFPWTIDQKEVGTLSPWIALQETQALWGPPASRPSLPWSSSRWTLCLFGKQTEGPSAIHTVCCCC